VRIEVPLHNLGINCVRLIRFLIRMHAYHYVLRLTSLSVSCIIYRDYNMCLEALFGALGT